MKTSFKIIISIVTAVIFIFLFVLPLKISYTDITEEAKTDYWISVDLFTKVVSIDEYEYKDGYELIVRKTYKVDREDLWNIWTVNKLKPYYNNQLAKLLINEYAKGSSILGISVSNYIDYNNDGKISYREVGKYTLNKMVF